MRDIGRAVVCGMRPSRTWYSLTGVMLARTTRIVCAVASSGQVGAAAGAGDCGGAGDCAAAETNMVATSSPAALRGRRIDIGHLSRNLYGPAGRRDILPRKAL